MRLWIPGPTQVREEILDECARPMIGHRSGDMERLIARLDPHLRLAFGLRDESTAQVGVHTCSATGFMEGALLGVGRRVLCVVSGAFGARWHEIATLLGKQAQVLQIEWGAAVRPEDLARALRRDGPFDAVTVISNETSTGVRAPLDALARVLADFPETMFLVDLVSWIAGAPVDFDARRMDLAFAGTQKALALPPGIAVACASARFLENARRVPQRGFYLDPVAVFEGHASRKTPSTPCIPLYYALARQLEDISAGLLEGGAETARAAWQARFERHERMQRRTEAWAGRMGLEHLPAVEERSRTVACIRAGRVDVPRFLGELKKRGHQIGNGYGKLKDKTFRIGHMGDHGMRDLEELLGAASEALAEQGVGLGLG